MTTQTSILSVTLSQPLRPPDPLVPQINRGKNISGAEAAKVNLIDIPDSFSASLLTSYLSFSLRSVSKTQVQM